MIWGYGNEFKEDVTSQPHNQVAFYTPELHNPQQVNRMLLELSIEGMPDVESHRQAMQVIWVHVSEYMDGELRTHCPTFQA